MRREEDPNDFSECHGQGCPDETKPLPPKPSSIETTALFAGRRVTQILLVILLWGTVWGTTGSEALPPNGRLFALIVLFIGATLGGQLVHQLNLPPLLGMLAVGFFISNITSITFDHDLSSTLRSFALTVILLRAGLGLDPNVLRKLSGVCFRLAVIPCLVETTTIGLVAHFLLDLPFQWSFLLGFVLAAISPAVVVPAMITFQEQKLGTDKGIPTLVIAASSVDDVLAISGFGVMLGFCFASEDSSLVWQLLKGPVAALVGLFFGLLLGFLFWLFPAPRGLPRVVNRLDAPEDVKRESDLQRFPLLLLGGTFAIFVSNLLDFSGAGPLGALSLAFVAGLKWRDRGYVDAVESKLKLVWYFSQPFLFGLIGAEVKLSNLEGNLLWPSMLALAIGLTARTIACSAAVSGIGLTLKERIFVSLAWLPKATVQAAVGPVALDMARHRNDPQDISLATTVLTVAVLSILIMAPLGAIAIAVTGPKLLNYEKSSYNEVLNEKKEISLVSANEIDNNNEKTSIELQMKCV